MFYSSLELKELNQENIPKEIGLYTLIDKETKAISFIGTATGKNGLYHRIWNQHLNPVYLETRKHIFTTLDIYQLEHPIYHNNQLAIDKSTFRKKVARKYLLKAGTESVNYIKEHFLLSFAIYPPEQQETVMEKAKMLIALHQPIYNGRLRLHSK